MSVDASGIHMSCIMPSFKGFDNIDLSGLTFMVSFIIYTTIEVIAAAYYDYL